MEDGGREVRRVDFSPFPRVKAGDLGAVGKGRWMSGSGGVREPQLRGSKHVQSTTKPGGPTWPLSIREMSRTGREAQDLLR